MEEGRNGGIEHNGGEGAMEERARWRERASKLVRVRPPFVVYNLLSGRGMSVTKGVKIGDK